MRDLQDTGEISGKELLLYSRQNAQENTKNALRKTHSKEPEATEISYRFGQCHH